MNDIQELDNTDGTLDDEARNTPGKSYSVKLRLASAWRYVDLLQRRQNPQGASGLPNMPEGCKLVNVVAQEYQVSAKFVFKYYRLLQSVYQSYTKANPTLNLPESIPTNNEIFYKYALQSFEQFTKKRKRLQLDQLLGKFGSIHDKCKVMFIIKFMSTQPRFNQYTSKSLRAQIVEAVINDVPAITNVFHAALAFLRCKVGQETRNAFEVVDTYLTTQVDPGSPIAVEMLTKTNVENLESKTLASAFNEINGGALTDESIKRCQTLYAANKLTDNDISDARKFTLQSNDIPPESLISNTHLPPGILPMAAWLNSNVDVLRFIISECIRTEKKGITPHVDSAFKLEEANAELQRHDSNSTTEEKNASKTVMQKFAFDVAKMYLTKSVTYKKINVKFSEQNQPRLQNSTDEHLKLMRFVESEKTTFLDEFSMVMNTSKNAAWGLQGQQPVIEKPENQEATTKVFAAMTHPPPDTELAVRNVRIKDCERFFMRIFPPLPQRIKQFQTDTNQKITTLSMKQTTITGNNILAGAEMEAGGTSQPSGRVPVDPEVGGRTRDAWKRRVEALTNNRIQFMEGSRADYTVGDLIFELRRRRDWLAPAGAPEYVANSCFCNLINELHINNVGSEKIKDDIIAAIPFFMDERLLGHEVLDPKDQNGQPLGVIKSTGQQDANGRTVYRKYSLVEASREQGAARQLTTKDIEDATFNGFLIRCAIYDYEVSKHIWNHNCMTTIDLPASDEGWLAWVRGDGDGGRGVVKRAYHDSVLMGCSTQLPKDNWVNGKLKNAITASPMINKTSLSLDFLGPEAMDENDTMQKILSDCFGAFYTNTAQVSPPAILRRYPINLEKMFPALNAQMPPLPPTVGLIYLTFFACDMLQGKAPGKSCVVFDVDQILTPGVSRCNTEDKAFHFQHEGDLAKALIPDKYCRALVNGGSLEEIRAYIMCRCFNVMCYICSAMSGNNYLESNNRSSSRSNALARLYATYGNPFSSYASIVDDGVKNAQNDQFMYEDAQQVGLPFVIEPSEVGLFIPNAMFKFTGIKVNNFAQSRFNSRNKIQFSVILWKLIHFYNPNSTWTRRMGLQWGSWSKDIRIERYFLDEQNGLKAWETFLNSIKEDAFTTRINQNTPLTFFPETLNDNLLTRRRARDLLNQQANAKCADTPQLINMDSDSEAFIRPTLEYLCGVLASRIGNQETSQSSLRGRLISQAIAQTKLKTLARDGKEYILDFESLLLGVISSDTTTAGSDVNFSKQIQKYVGKPEICGITDFTLTRLEREKFEQEIQQALDKRSATTPLKLPEIDYSETVRLEDDGITVGEYNTNVYNKITTASKARVVQRNSNGNLNVNLDNVYKSFQMLTLIVDTAPGNRKWNDETLLNAGYYTPRMLALLHSFDRGYNLKYQPISVKFGKIKRKIQVALAMSNGYRDGNEPVSTRIQTITFIPTGPEASNMRLRFQGTIKGYLGQADLITYPIKYQGRDSIKKNAEYIHRLKQGSQIKEKDSGAKSFEVNKYLMREYVLALPHHFIADLPRLAANGALPRGNDVSTQFRSMAFARKTVIMDNSTLHWKVSASVITKAKAEYDGQSAGRNAMTICFPFSELSEISIDMKVRYAYFVGIDPNAVLALLTDSTKTHAERLFVTKQDIAPDNLPSTIFNPAYSPRLNAIEMAFNVIKHFVKLYISRNPRSRKNLSAAILHAAHYHTRDVAVINFTRCAGYGTSSHPVSLPMGWKQLLTEGTAKQCVGLRGDTWESLARRHNIKSSTLKEFNNHLTTGITPGDIIYVPVKDTILYTLAISPADLRKPKDTRWDVATNSVNAMLREKKFAPVTKEELQNYNLTIQGKSVELRNMINITVPIKNIKAYEMHHSFATAPDEFKNIYSELRFPIKDDFIAVLPSARGNVRPKARLCKVIEVNMNTGQVKYKYLLPPEDREMRQINILTDTNAIYAQKGLKYSQSRQINTTGTNRNGGTMIAPAWEFADNLSVQWINSLEATDKRKYLEVMFDGQTR